MADLRKRANLLPDHARPRERAIADTDGRLEDLDVDRVRRVRDPDRADEADLKFLAWERSVDVWDAAWPEAVRRAVVKAAPVVHRHKGTLGGVEAAFGALGMSVAVTEWWQQTPPAKPYTFEVKVFVRGRLYDGPVLDARLIRVAYALLMRAKPLSRAFTFKLAAEFPAGLGLAGVAVARSVVRTAAVAAPAAEVFPATLGLAGVALARSRVTAAFASSP